MSTAAARRLQFAAVCVALVAYLGLSHYCNTVSRNSDLGAALALAPELAAGFVVAWRWTSLITACGLALAVGLLLHHYWGLLQVGYAWVYLLQDVGLDAFLGLGFARSLLPERTALCTALADRVHGPLSGAEQRYTRQVTAAWAAFFFAMMTASVTLFFLAPLRLWSYFVNLCAFPLIGLMFVVENLVRSRVLPRGDRPGILATMRVYLASPQ